MLLQTIHDLGNCMAKLERCMDDLDKNIDALKDEETRREMRKHYNDLLRAIERHDYSTQHLLECMEDVLLNN